jgi:Swt1-like HEPN
MSATEGPIDQALDILRDALVPFVERNLARHFTANWFDVLNQSSPQDKQLRKDPETNLVYWSPDQVLTMMTIVAWDAFKSSFKKRSVRPLSRAETYRQDFVAKGWIEELIEIRRKKMHQEEITQNDVFRFIDTAQLLLRAAYCAEAADALRDIIPGKAHLEVNYSDEYDRDFKNARELWITGTNLRRIVTGQGSSRYLDLIKSVLSKNGTVKILMNHPDSEACQYAMMQDGPHNNLLDYRQGVGDNLNTFCTMRDTVPRGKTNMLIRTIDYMLTFGLDIMNGQDETRGVTYVRFYPLPKKLEMIDDRPLVRLSCHDATWYKFFVGQFERHWNDEANRGYAVEVPVGYRWKPQ